MNRIILDLCGGTGSWSKPYADSGYDVRVIDPYRSTGDIRLFEKPDYAVWGILAAPPCTHLAVSGARWWKQKGDDALLDALSVVDACIRIVTVCKPVWWVIENPVGRLTRYLGKPSMYFNPCDYGDPYTKKTALWGSFRFPLKSPVEPTEGSKMHKIGPSPDRQRIRSITPQGFANAFFAANP
ncbi:MAG: hypothetical protein AB7V04_07110 [Desulfomonilaceae bacterium]